MSSQGSYRDAANDPLSEAERADIYRKTSDPTSFHENMIHWLNVKYIDEFPQPPHGAQYEMSEDWTNPSSAENVVEWQTVNHDTNSYILGNTFRIPGIPTLKLSGVYTMSVDLTFDGADFGTDAWVGIFRNDVPIAIETIDPDLKTVSLCVVRRLNENDIIDVRAYKSAGTQTILAFDADYLVKPVFNIALLYLMDNYEEEAVVDPCNPPVNTVAPALSVTTFQPFDANITCTDGTWTGDATITYTYQWQIQDEGVGAWSDIIGETTNSLDPSTYGGDANDKVRCVVTATNDCGSASANSNTATETAE